MALEDTLRGIREASAKRIPADRAAVMHRATRSCAPQASWIG